MPGETASVSQERECAVPREVTCRPDRLVVWRYPLHRARVVQVSNGLFRGIEGHGPHPVEHH
jgi:hypothetical protein